MNLSKKIAITLIRFYQLLLSPLLPRACRFEPTCSEYARECFQKFSFFKAFWMTLNRIGRCHPWGGYGYDPVPTCDHSKHHNPI